MGYVELNMVTHEGWPLAGHTSPWVTAVPQQGWGGWRGWRSSILQWKVLLPQVNSSCLLQQDMMQHTAAWQHCHVIAPNVLSCRPCSELTPWGLWTGQMQPVHRCWVQNMTSLQALNPEHNVRVPIFPIVVCVRSAYVIGAGVGFRVESGAVALLQLDLWGYPLH